MNKFATYFASALMALSAVACGSKAEGDETAADFNDEDLQIVIYMSGPDYLTPKQLDSLAINCVDDLTPGQAVGILLYYNDLVEKASGSRRTERIRMFKDVYDISLGNLGDQFRQSLSIAKADTGKDLAAVYERLSDRLSEYDSAAGIAIEPESQPDSAAVDSAATDSTRVVPVNHSDRRAESNF